MKRTKEEMNEMFLEYARVFECEARMYENDGKEVWAAKMYAKSEAYKNSAAELAHNMK